jgi:6-phosphogluconate dehydrogenase
MIPAAAVDGVIAELAPLLAAGDTVIDGGNSHFVDDVRRAAELGKRDVHYLDVGVSGGIFGLEHGYCLMIGGDRAARTRLTPLFTALAPGASETPPSAGTAPQGYLHCGPSDFCSDQRLVRWCDDDDSRSLRQPARRIAEQLAAARRGW